RPGARPAVGRVHSREGCLRFARLPLAATRRVEFGRSGVSRQVGTGRRLEVSAGEARGQRGASSLRSLSHGPSYQAPPPLPPPRRDCTNRHTNTTSVVATMSTITRNQISRSVMFAPYALIQSRADASGGSVSATPLISRPVAVTVT